MVAEALYKNDPSPLGLVAEAALTSGQVIELPDGRAGVVDSQRGFSANDLASVKTSGVFLVQKTTGMVILAGGKVFWDYSTNKAHFKAVGDRDFYLGTAVKDAALNDTTVLVNFNVLPSYLVDLARDPFVTAIVL